MENSSACDRSDDDGSVIICIETDDADEFEEQSDNEQEMEITSSDVIIRNPEGSIEDKMHTEPDSSDKMSETSSNIQAKNIELIKKIKIEVTSSDTNTSLLLEKKDILHTDPDSSYKDQNIIVTTYDEEGEVQMLEKMFVEKDKLHTNPITSNKDKVIYLTTSTEEDEVQILEERRVDNFLIPNERRVDKDKLHTNPVSFNKDKTTFLTTSTEEDEVKILEERRVEKEALHTDPEPSNKDQNTIITTSDEEGNVQMLEERNVEKDAVQAHPLSSTTVEQINIAKSNKEEEVKITEEIKVEKEGSLHIPTKILQNLIAKAIISSPNGFLSVEDFEQCLIQMVPCRGKKTGLKKLILNTLENNSDVFMSLIRKNENNLESGFWTLHPVAAANFVYCDTLEKSVLKKQKDCNFQIQKKHAAVADDKIYKKPVVAVKRSSTVDYWASKRKVAKMETITMVMPSSDVVNTLMNYGISFEKKWEGWKSLDKEQENKISKLENIIKSSVNSVTPESSKMEGKEQVTQSNSTTTLKFSAKSLLKRKGIKRVRLSDSCSDLDSSDNETPVNGSIVHKEHNYVASKDSSGSKNLIESLRQIVQKMDKDCDKKSVNRRTNSEVKTSESESQDEEEDFLGFDYDLLSGYWRGWEKASSRNAEKMKEISRSQEGSRDLEEVLRESELAVTRCIESGLISSNVCDQALNPIDLRENSLSKVELERCDLRNEEKAYNPKTCDVDATTQKYLEELMTLFDHMAEEPPISYRVLTVMAMCASPEPAVTVAEICQFIQQHFPFHCGRPQFLEHLVEVLLCLGSPAPFSCQKSRRTCNPATCWRVDSTSACKILGRALESVKMRNQLSRSPLTNAIEDYVKDNHDLLENNAIKQQGVIVDGKTLGSPNKTCHKKHEIPINIHRIQLSGEECNPSKENVMKHLEITADFSNNSQIATRIFPAENAENKTVKDFNKSIVVSSAPVILSVDSYSESTKIKQNVTPPHVVKHVESVTPKKINGIKSPCKYPLIYTEDQELEIVDIDPSLQDKENSSLSSEDDEIIVIDEDTEQVHNSSNHGHERLFGSEQSSITNEWTNEVGDRTSNCLFLLRCHNLDSENKQYPCYICHKFYGSKEVLNIHFAQTHFEKVNLHVTSALCQIHKRKPKSIKGTPNMVIIPSENSFRSEIIGSRPCLENILIDLQSKRSDGVIRYNCSKCNAIFHEKETLNLHISLFHEDASLRSLIPLKQVSTPEGNRFYYCDQCSGCFHTEKALVVHECVPFSRAHSSSS